MTAHETAQVLVETMGFEPTTPCLQIAAASPIVSSVVHNGAGYKGSSVHPCPMVSTTVRR